MLCELVSEVHEQLVLRSKYDVFGVVLKFSVFKQFHVKKLLNSQISPMFFCTIMEYKNATLKRNYISNRCNVAFFIGEICKFSFACS